MELQILENQLTMSSLEVADLCEKEHKNVLADIKHMLEQLDIPTAEFSAMYKANNGQNYECFNLNKELSLTLVAGYNIRLRHKIIQRWQYLEDQLKYQNLPDFTNPILMAREWANQLEQNQIALAKIADLSPKAEFFDAAMASEDLIDMREVAIILNNKMGRNKLFSLLRFSNWLDENNKPYQAKVDAGYFKVIESTYKHPKTNEDKINLKTMVTQKGLDAIRKLIKRI